MIIKSEYLIKWFRY